MLQRVTETGDQCCDKHASRYRSQEWSVNLYTQPMGPPKGNGGSGLRGEVRQANWTGGLGPHSSGLMDPPLTKQVGSRVEG